MKPEDILAREAFFHRLNTDPEFPGQFRKGYDTMMPETFLKVQS